ncbi:MAG: hypothetical protein IJ764_00325 [Bacteroidales bacterium]|nr:hypothetical protein [Bacteroidales bacterium]
MSQVFSAPVALVGGLRSVDYIQQMLDSSQIAYASLSRPLIREPDLVNRWKAGDTSPSRCISCNSCYHTSGHVCLFNQ